MEGGCLVRVALDLDGAATAGDDVIDDGSPAERNQPQVLFDQNLIRATSGRVQGPCCCTHLRGYAASSTAGRVASRAITGNEIPADSSSDFGGAHTLLYRSANSDATKTLPLAGTQPSSRADSAATLLKSKNFPGPFGE